jgi:predicted transcriptional regulator
MTNEFFKVYRKKGFNEALIVLSNNGKILESEFFKKLTESGIYFNSFYRIKPELLKYNLMVYSLDENTYDKKIELTEKGKKILILIDQINTEFTSNN